MKKIIAVLFTVFVLSFNVYAGSIPEDLIHSDNAQIFFAEVISYNENSDIEILPVKKIKGDVNIGSNQIYHDPNVAGNFQIKVGNTYLFTYFDENNPTDIFETTSMDTKTLKLKNVTGDMWERFENNLNSGKYEKAEQKRIDKINSELEAIGNKISLLEFLNIDKEKIKRIDDIEISFGSTFEKYEIDEDDFIKVAKKIMLTDVENTAIVDEGFPKGGIYITVTFENEESKPVLMPVYAYISDKCQVDSYSLFMSRFPMTDYIITFDDYTKLINLTYEKTDYDNILYTVILAVIIAVISSAVIRKKKSKNGNQEEE